MRILPKDIYNFYYLFYFYTQNNSIIKTHYGEFVYNLYLSKLKTKYIYVFSNLLREQLKKYKNLNRVDDDFDIKIVNDENCSSYQLHQQMKKTYRGDKIRRNTVWEYISENLYFLDQTELLEKIMIYIDRLNNSVHNSECSIYEKFPNQLELLKALDFAANCNDIRNYFGLIDSDIRNIKNL